MMQEQEHALVGDGPTPAASRAGAAIVGVGARVYIRDHVVEDFPRMREIWSDPVAVHHMAMRPKTEEQMTAALESLVAPDPHVRHSDRFAIVRRSDDVVLGTHGIDFERFSSAYTHTMVLHRDSWGMGLATEARRLLLAYAFEDVGVHRVWSACAVDNDRARKLIERTGGVWFGIAREFFRRDGVASDCHLFSCLDHEWRRHLGRLSGGAFR
jgi:RimJ/RimL family protein N-acetyltransferase